MEQQWIKNGAKALREAALNPYAKAFILSNLPVYDLLKKAAERYIGGETLQETVLKVRAMNGMKCSIEFMGEDTLTFKESADATAEFLNVCGIIRDQQLNATISLDLSHIGLNVSRALCVHHLEMICREAAKAGTEVIISAEGTEKTDSVLGIYLDSADIYDNLSITLQAYLYRSKDDFVELLQKKGRIRVVKGAFETADGLSMGRGKVLDDTYLSYVDQLLSMGHKCSIATHDASIQQSALQFALQYKAKKENYEFESLFGINYEQLQGLQIDGHPTKVYFVYGREWYLYLCNRIAEFPLHIFRALEDILL